MADKGFGIKELNLVGASGVPTIESPNNLNLNAVNVAISTHVSVGDTLKVGTGVTAHAGVVTATKFVGDGSGLTDLQVSSVGTATTSTYAGSWVLGANGTTDYTFTGNGLTGAVNDPILHLQRGEKYIFKNRSGGHPFRIQTSYKNTSGTAYNTGVTNNAGGNGTDIIFEVPQDAPDTLYYQCTAHTNMSGAFIIPNKPAPNENILMNGQFDVWQRATDGGESTSDGFLAADRWFYAASGATKRPSQATFTAGQTDVPANPKYYHRYATSIGNNNAAMRYRIEDVKKYSGQTLTLSYWAKGSNPNGGTFDMTWRQDFGTGGSNVLDIGVGSFSITGTWTKYTFTVNVPSVSGKTINESDSFLEIEPFRQPAGDTSTNAWTFDVTNIKLEVGPVATDYVQQSYGDELNKCMRYCYVMKGDSNDMTGAVGWCGGSDGGFPMRLPVPMRAAPDFTASGTWRLNCPGGNGSDQTSNLVWQHTNLTFDAGWLYLSSVNTASNAGQAAFLQLRGSGTKLTWEAELS